MDDGEPSQLYKTLLLEQEMNPSQAVSVLIQYYRMSEEEAQLVSREYHAREINGQYREQLISSHKSSRRSTKGDQRQFSMASLRGGTYRAS